MPLPDDHSEHKCRCPSCRHSRGEITDNEFAWYLKGQIELLHWISKSILAKIGMSVTGERAFDMAIDDARYNEAILRELIRHMEDTGASVDPAFREPEAFIYSKEMK